MEAAARGEVVGEGEREGLPLHRADIEDEGILQLRATRRGAADDVELGPHLRGDAAACAR